MRIFVTGASGFVGSAIVSELLAHGHQVAGLVRSEKSASAVKAAGAEPVMGDVNDPQVLKKSIATCDAVIHTAFNHDFSRYAQSCEDDRLVIGYLGEAIGSTGKPLLITSGIGLLNYDRVVTEDDELSSGSSETPRSASEEAAKVLMGKGGNVYIVRLPPSVHGRGDHGFVPMLIDTARSKQEAAFAGDGSNRWTAVHRSDAAAVYRLIVEKQPAQRVYHPVAEESIAFSEIARAIGQGLQLPVVSKTGTKVADYFGWLAHFAAMDCPASGAKTRETLQWQPKAASLIQDIRSAGYFENQ
jgi:nucleoside-diphosphate-sugar epimerase